MGKRNYDRGKLMIVNTDIDIDIADRDKLLNLIKNVPATINDKGKVRKHNTGVYFHEIPSNPFNGMASLDYKEAEDLGYFKIDVLNVNLYKNVKDRNHLRQLINMEPIWELLEHKEVVEQCFHIHNHFDVVQKMKPTSVDQLAAVLAVIRPAKRHLLGKTWNEILADVWIKPSDDSYYFKKAHAHAYALAIVVQLNLLSTNFSL